MLSCGLLPSLTFVHGCSSVSVLVNAYASELLDCPFTACLPFFSFASYFSSTSESILSLANDFTLQLLY